MKKIYEYIPLLIPSGFWVAGLYAMIAKLYGIGIQFIIACQIITAVYYYLEKEEH